MVQRQRVEPERIRQFQEDAIQAIAHAYEDVAARYPAGSAPPRPRFAIRRRVPRMMMLAAVEAGLVAWMPSHHTIAFYTVGSSLGRGKVVNLRDLLQDGLIDWRPAGRPLGVVTLTDRGRLLLDQERRDVKENDG